MESCASVVGDSHLNRALEEVGLENEFEPKDFMNLFCLGNREAQDREVTSHSGSYYGTYFSSELIKNSRKTQKSKLSYTACFHVSKDYASHFSNK